MRTQQIVRLFVVFLFVWTVPAMAQTKAAGTAYETQYIEHGQKAEVSAVSYVAGAKVLTPIGRVPTDPAEAALLVARLMAENDALKGQLKSASTQLATVKVSFKRQETKLKKMAEERDVLKQTNAEQVELLAQIPTMREDIKRLQETVRSLHQQRYKTLSIAGMYAWMNRIAYTVHDWAAVAMSLIALVIIGLVIIRLARRRSLPRPDDTSSASVVGAAVGSIKMISLSRRRLLNLHCPPASPIEMQQAVE
jgi:hypothetical protein